MSTSSLFRRLTAPLAAAFLIAFTAGCGGGGWTTTELDLANDETIVVKNHVLGRENVEGMTALNIIQTLKDKPLGAASARIFVITDNPWRFETVDLAQDQIYVPSRVNFAGSFTEYMKQSANRWDWYESPLNASSVIGVVTREGGNEYRAMSLVELRTARSDPKMKTFDQRRLSNLSRDVDFWDGMFERYRFYQGQGDVVSWTREQVMPPAKD